MTRLLRPLSALIPILLTLNAYADVTLFSTDFDTAIPPEVTPGDAFLTGVQGYAGLGPDGNQFAGTFLRSPCGNVVTLTLTGLPQHSSISLEFLLAAIDSLDGSTELEGQGWYIGDFFLVTLDGSPIFLESFENAIAIVGVQSYVPPPGVELARHSDLGFNQGQYFYTDSAYNLGADPVFQAIPHTGSTAVFTFEITGPGIQELEDESWAMDNLRVTVVPVPPPVADAGEDQTVRCTVPAGAFVTLDGSGSYDPQGDDLIYEWSVAAGSGVVLEHPDQAVTLGAFPIGVHEVTLTVYDVNEFGAPNGGVDCDSVTIIVFDDDPPVARVTTDVASLWPANGAMVRVTILVEASDACTAPANLCTYCIVSSSQPDDTAGAANRTGDVNGVDGYVAPVEVTLTNVGDGKYGAEIDLRAERDPSASTGRTYSIDLSVEDRAGNVGQASTTVVVPHDGRGR